jgi:hypothetical protein
MQPLHAVAVNLIERRVALRGIIVVVVNPVVLLCAALSNRCSVVSSAADAELPNVPTASPMPAIAPMNCSHSDASFPFDIISSLCGGDVERSAAQTA